MPKVFLSYSWDDDDHKRWVRDLASRLRQDGIETLLDQWHLVPGDQLPVFMETAVRESDFTLIICTSRYKDRADSRAGGVGYEGDIITGEIFTRRNTRKFIPLLVRSTWSSAAPSWLQDKYYLDFRNTPPDDAPYVDLVKTILGKREQAPPIGQSGPLTPLRDERPDSISSSRSKPSEKRLTSYSRGIRVPDQSPEVTILLNFFSKAQGIAKLLPIYLLFLGLLCFVFLGTVSDVRPEAVETSPQVTEASDYYILRDVSGSTHFRPEVQKFYDTVELIIRETVRPQDRLASDFMSYGQFAAYVANGHGDLQPATGDPDIIGESKNNLAAWIPPKNFFNTTDYERLFISIRTAIAGGDQRRRSFVFIITDGMPDLVGNENYCPPTGRFFPLSVENAFRDLIMNTKRAQFFILLSGGRPECSEHVMLQWKDMSQSMLREQDLQGRVVVRSLEGLAGTQIEDAILEDLARFGRRPSITVQSTMTRLTDDQRKALDKGEEFNGEFFIRAHFGDHWDVSIPSAVIRDRQGKSVGEVDVLNGPGGDPHDPSDLFTVKIDNELDRDSKRKKYLLFFQPRWRILPNEMESYFIILQVESRLRSKLYREKAAKVEAAPGENGRARAKIVHRLALVAVLSFLMAVAMIVLLVLYVSKENGGRQMRRLVRYMIIDPIKHWSAGFAVTASLLLALGMTALARTLARTSTLTITLGVIVVLVAVLSTLSIMQRPKDEIMHLSRTELFLFSLDATAIPVISIILVMPLW